VAFAPDGHTLASGGATAVLWDVTNMSAPRPLGQPLTGQNRAISAVAFASDGQTLATASDDSTVILWDLAERAAPRRLGEPLTGHTGKVTAVSFAPDDQTLATASDDSSVILWDLADRGSPRHLAEPLAGDSQIASVAIASNGHTLATADGSSTVIWDLSTLAEVRANPVKYACVISGDGLDRDEWNRHVPGLPYESTCF
jgi:WD40 repeat protein